MAVARQPASYGNIEMLADVGGEQEDNLAQPSTSPMVLAIVFLELTSWMLQSGRSLESGFPTNTGFVGQPKNPTIGCLSEMVRRKGPWCIF